MEVAIMNSLEEKTKTYWKVSSIREGRLSAEITTTSAIAILGDVIENLGPQRRLLYKAMTLQDAIVEGPKRKRAKPRTKPKNILPLIKQAQ